MKKGIVVVLLCLMSILAFGSSKMGKIVDRGYIRVGTTGDYKPFTYYNGSLYEGYDIEIAKLIGKELGVEVKFIKTTWKDLMKDLKDDKFDIAMGGISRNLSRKLDAELTEPYLTYGKTPIVRTEEQKRYKSLEDIDRKTVRVGVNIGGTNEKFADANIKNAEIIKFVGNLEVVESVKDGKVDVMISETPEALYYENLNKGLASPMTDSPMTKSQLGYVINKGELDFLSTINFILDELELRGVISQLKKEYNL